MNANATRRVVTACPACDGEGGWVEHMPSGTVILAGCAHCGGNGTITVQVSPLSDAELDARSLEQTIAHHPQHPDEEYV